MARKAPGKAHRRGLTPLQIADMFRDEEAARNWIAENRWPSGPCCPHCSSKNVQCGINHKTMPHRCRTCPKKRMFSVKTGTLMAGSNLPYRMWAAAIYLFVAKIRGFSSMSLHREFGIGQKAAWFMLHRLRITFESGYWSFHGPVAVDETYIGGKHKKMRLARRKAFDGLGSGVGQIVAGGKDRETNLVSARVIENTNRETLQGFRASWKSIPVSTPWSSLTTSQAMPGWIACIVRSITRSPGTCAASAT